MSDASSEPSYRLSELGWLQFDRLCSLVLEAETGIGAIEWSGQSDVGRTATIKRSVRLPSWSVTLAGPVTAVTVWIPGDVPDAARLSELRRRIVALLRGSDVMSTNELVVLTNLDTEAVDSALRGDVSVPCECVVVIGADRLGARLDDRPDLRAALPSVLGLRDLEPLIDPDVRDRSRFDLMRAQALAGVFWPTRAYEQARMVLDRHRFVVLTGPPEMGKTAIALTLALAHLTDGWQVHDCTDPDQVWRAFDPDGRQLFVADDAFGSTEYRPDAAERWASALGRLLPMLDAEHWLIWTSRPAPLKAGLRRVQREHGSERFPAPGEVLVDAGALDLREKTLILFRHAKAHGVSGEAREQLCSAGVSIVQHPHFTPERIRRFVSDWVDELPALAAEGDNHVLLVVERELATPTEAMRTSYAALAPEHRDLLVALLDAPAGLIDERELAVTVRRHHPGGLSRPPGELIDRLIDHFVRVTTLGIGWVHPSWRDLVIDELRSDERARGRFLAACGVDGVMLALSRQGGVSGERQLPLLANDADWDRLGDRMRELLHGLEPRDLLRVLVALESALADLGDERQRREAQSLAVQVLDATRRAWDHTRQTVPSFLLEAWYRLRRHVRGGVGPPQLAATWAELRPGGLLLEQPGVDELVRADEWLAVAQILRVYDLATLGALGFFDHDREFLERLIVTLAQTTAASEEVRALAQSVLGRIEDLVPDLSAPVLGAIAIVGLAEDLEHRRWWVPEDIAAPPTMEPVVAVTDFTVRHVGRVLNDL